ncbi:26S proteasome non-ATPase regulatory subunit 6-like [Oopsacas minuta]|uniref:26S proteasome non-ATPase regulatory subunit 6 n=1 Tax=Oopsacas minuta TaxID=111878 RepID=A0AAV7KGF7_9METZ|nr:26S proteasome non-ATPase regulatory subunit 6-like [Oopsacas minuta]
MPIENLEEEGLAKNPNLELSQLRFLARSSPLPDVRQECIDQLMTAIVKDNMAPFYSEICEELGIQIDPDLLSKLREANKTRLDELEAELKEAEVSSGESEIREIYLNKAEYLCLIGDKDAAVTAFRQTFEKTVPIGQKLDVVFHLIRMGLFYLDYDLAKRNIAKAKTLIEEGGDWDRRNRLKVYEAVYCMSIRNFLGAANNFLDTVSTFTSYELMPYPRFIWYTVLCALIALKRVDINKKVVKCPEILEVLHSNSQLSNYMMSLYNCNYAQFFKALAQMEGDISNDSYLSPHYRYLIREMRIIAYTQLLHSYQSLTIPYMARAFGVTEAFIDGELSTFISAGRLDCKIDKVGGIVETNWPDSKNKQYEEVIKKGDVLLNRLQKLRRVVNL